MQDPQTSHFDAAMRVLRYLKSSPGQGILLSSSSSLILAAYRYSDWAGCPLIRRSTTGYFTMLSDSPIFRKSIKQKTVSKSSTEAEYRAISSATSELIWLQSILHVFKYLIQIP